MEHLEKIKKSVWNLYYEDYITYEEFLKIIERVIEKYNEYSKKKIRMQMNDHIPRID